MQRPPPDFEVVEFEPIEEHWNKYELQNHTVVRGRIIVTRFARNSHAPDPTQFAISTQNIFVVDAPPESRGTPTPPLTMEEIANPQGVPVPVLTSNEVWNKYRILQNGLVLKVKMVLDEAVRIQDKFDNDGMPQYVFRSSPLMTPDRRANSNIRT